MDTGVFVAGIFWHSEPHKCVKAWLAGLVSLVVSDAIYQEHDRTLHKVKAAQGFNTNLAPWLALVRNYGKTRLRRRVGHPSWMVCSHEV